MKQRAKRIWKSYKGLLLIGLAGLPAGAAVGAIDALFGRVLLWLTAIRTAHPFWFLPFLSLAGVLVVFCFTRFGKNSGKGMNLIFSVGQGSSEEIPIRLIPLVMGGTWIAHLFGASVGREGVAVQIGAAFSSWFGKKLPIDDAPRIFLIAGMAAGFSGLFRTPMAAIFFAMEVMVVGKIEYKALFPAFTASFTASWISGLLGLEKFSVDLSQVLPDGITWNLQNFLLLLLLGLIFGLVGGGFAWALKWGKMIAADRLVRPIPRIFLMGLFLSVLFLLLGQGRYSGLGTNLISASMSGGTIYAWDWVLKLVLTILCLSAGYQGGEVTPLFAIGASLGVVLAGLLGVPPVFAAALGYAAVFGSATNTFLAPIFIGAEVFGYEYLPCFFVVCSMAYLFNLNKSIYGMQKLLKSR